ncbi:MAG: STAS domain-containing protein [Solirubrobacterales bacterium]
MHQEENVATEPPATPFSVLSENEGGATVISVVGELDLSTAPQLEECLRSAEANVVVDLSACEFIDSTGIALLVRASQGSDGDGARIAICGLKQQVLRVLQVTGVEEMILTKPTRREAIESLLA